jgi:hypothetical protein
MKHTSTTAYAGGGKALSSLYFGAAFHIIIKVLAISGKIRHQKKRKRLRHGWRKSIRS